MQRGHWTTVRRPEQPTGLSSKAVSLRRSSPLALRGRPSCTGRGQSRLGQVGWRWRERLLGRIWGSREFWQHCFRQGPRRRRRRFLELWQSRRFWRCSPRWSSRSYRSSPSSWWQPRPRRWGRRSRRKGGLLARSRDCQVSEDQENFETTCPFKSQVPTSKNRCLLVQNRIYSTCKLRLELLTWPCILYTLL